MCSVSIFVWTRNEYLVHGTFLLPGTGRPGADEYKYFFAPFELRALTLQDHWFELHDSKCRTPRKHTEALVAWYALRENGCTCGE